MEVTFIHNQSYLVPNGAFVQEGQNVGTLGDSGASSPHAHCALYHVEQNKMAIPKVGGHVCGTYQAAFPTIPSNFSK